MARIACITSDPNVIRTASTVLGDRHVVEPVEEWHRLQWLLRERAYTSAIVDSAAFPRGGSPEDLLADLTLRYPSLSIVLAHRSDLDPRILLWIGRRAVRNLEMVEVGGLLYGLADAHLRAAQWDAEPWVIGGLSSHVDRWGLSVIRTAMHAVQLGASADTFAARTGQSRPHLSVRLRADGLPSAGKLLTWAKLFHAARWLPDPGRSAQSVARQLRYANGATFRRALRHYTGLTPTGVVEGGGISRLLKLFLDDRELPDSVWGARFA